MRTLLRGLASIEASKTLFFVSEGFPIDDQRSAVSELGALAGLARTSIYALRLDNRLFDMADPTLPTMPAYERAMLIDSMDSLAESSRGASFAINGAGTGVFERIESELSGYYLARRRVGADRQERHSPSRSRLTSRGRGRPSARAA